MFGRKKAEDPTGSTAVSAAPEATDPAPVDGKKGRPTPSRKQQEAARRRPLVPADRKAAKAESRQAERERRAIAQAGMAAGDERFLGPRDRGPQRRFARDWIDSRFNIGEYILFFLVLMLVVLMVPNRSVSLVFIWIAYGFIGLCVLDAVITTSRMHSVMRQKFGQVQRGTRWYAAMRTMTFRKMRLPKPQVARGERPH